MTQIKDIDIRTEREKERDEKKALIVEEYCELKKLHKEASPHRLFKVLAERHGMAYPTIRDYVREAGQE